MLKFRFSTSQTRWVTRSESVQFIHFITSTLFDSDALCSALSHSSFLSLALFLSTKHQVELLLRANRLNLIRLHSDQTAKEAFSDHPPDFSFKQRKTITFKFPDKKITGSKPWKHLVGNECLNCSPGLLRHPYLLLLFQQQIYLFYVFWYIRYCGKVMRAKLAELHPKQLLF